MTIPHHIYINLDGHFKFQQPYVASSRCTKPENLHIFNLPNRDKFQPLYSLTKILLDYIDRVNIISHAPEIESFPQCLVANDVFKNKIPVNDNIPQISTYLDGDEFLCEDEQYDNLIQDLDKTLRINKRKKPNLEHDKNDGIEKPHLKNKPALQIKTQILIWNLMMTELILTNK